MGASLWLMGTLKPCTWNLSAEKSPFQDNRERLIPALIAAARDTIFSLTRGTPEPLSRIGLQRVAASRERHTPGFHIALHSFGGRLNWNPHLHILITAGGLALDNKSFIHTGPRSWMSAQELRIEWHRRLVLQLEAEHEAHPLVCRKLKCGRHRKLKVEPLLGFVGHMKWWVYIGPALENPAQALSKPHPLQPAPGLGGGQNRQVRREKGAFLFKDYRQAGRKRPMTLSAFDFVLRLIQHIPDRQARHFRGYGLFSSRAKTKSLDQARRLLSFRRPGKPPPPTWKQRRAQCGEKGALCCPKCKGPMTYRGHFFGSSVKLAQGLGLELGARIPHRTYLTREQLAACS